MAKYHGTSRQIKCAFGSELPLLLLTIALTSLLSSPHICASSDERLQYVPTLKEMYGGVPKNSFPVVHRDTSMIQSNTEFSSKRTQPLFESLRRGLRSRPHAFTVPVTDVNSNQGAYFAQMQIGTPPQSVLLFIDTGSQDFWVQNKGCNECFPELLPPYDPTISSTFEPDIVNGSYNLWGITYVDQSGDSGYTARETLTIDSGDGNRIVIPGFQFGVAVNNTGENIVSSGLLGLMPVQGQPYKLSPFLAQLATIRNGTYSKFSKNFRYCLPDRTKHNTTASFISFGDIDESDTNSLFSSTKHLYKSKIHWTPIVPNPPYSRYALNMTAISVGGNRIPIDPQELTLESVRLNGTITIIDTGTTINQLREPYYSQFLIAYYNATSNLGSLTTLLEDGTFNISADVFDAYLFPTVSLIFQKWERHDNGERRKEIELFLPKDNMVIPYADNTYLLNIFPALDNITNIIGNYAQQNFLIEYDLEKSRVGFLPASCTFE